MKPSGWEVYYVVFLSGLLSLGIPAALWFLSELLKGKSSSSGPNRALPPQERGDSVFHGRRFNTRFFLAANASVVLVSAVLVLIPCVSALSRVHQGSAIHAVGNAGLLRILAAIVTIVSLIFIGLIYSRRKGDLGWMTNLERHD